MDSSLGSTYLQVPVDWPMRALLPVDPFVVACSMRAIEVGDRHIKGHIVEVGSQPYGAEWIPVLREFEEFRLQVEHPFEHLEIPVVRCKLVRAETVRDRIELRVELISFEENWMVLINELLERS